MTQLSSDRTKPIGDKLAIWKLTFFKFYFELLNHREQTKNLFLNYSTKYISFEFLLRCFPFFIGLTQLVLLRYQNQLTSEVLQKTIPGLGKSYNPISWETFEHLNYKSYLTPNGLQFVGEPVNFENQTGKTSPIKPIYRGYTPSSIEKIDVYSDSLIITAGLPKKDQILNEITTTVPPTFIGEIQPASQNKGSLKSKSEHKGTSSSSPRVAAFTQLPLGVGFQQKTFIIPSQNAIAFYNKHYKDGNTVPLFQLNRSLGSAFDQKINLDRTPYVYDELPQKVSPIYLPSSAQLASASLESTGTTLNNKSNNQQTNTKLTKYYSELNSLLYRKGLALNTALLETKNQRQSLDSLTPLDQTLNNEFAPTTNQISKTRSLSDQKDYWLFPSHAFDWFFNKYSNTSGSRKNSTLGNSGKSNFAGAVFNEKQISDLTERLEKYKLLENFTPVLGERYISSSSQGLNGKVKRTDTKLSTNWNTLNRVQTLLTQWNYLQKFNVSTNRLMSGYYYPDSSNTQVKTLNSTNSISSFFEDRLSQVLKKSHRATLDLPIKIQLPGNSTITCLFNNSENTEFSSFNRDQGLKDLQSRSFISSSQSSISNSPTGFSGRKAQVEGSNTSLQNSSRSSLNVPLNDQKRGAGEQSTQRSYLEFLNHFSEEFNVQQQPGKTGGTETKILPQLRKENFLISTQNSEKPAVWPRKTKKTYTLLDTETYDLSSNQLSMRNWLKNYLTPDNPALNHKNNFLGQNINSTDGKLSADGRSSESTKKSNNTKQSTDSEAQPQVGKSPGAHGSVTNTADIGTSTSSQSVFNLPWSVQKAISEKETNTQQQQVKASFAAAVTKSVKSISIPTQTDANGQVIDLNRETRRWTIPGYQTWQIPLLNKHSSLFLLERLEPNLYKKLTELLGGDSSQVVSSESKSILQDSFSRNVLPLTEVRYPLQNSTVSTPGSNLLNTKGITEPVRLNETKIGFAGKNSILTGSDNTVLKYKSSGTEESYSLLKSNTAGPTIQFHYLPIAEGTVNPTTRNQTQIAGTYSKITSLYSGQSSVGQKDLSQNTQKINNPLWVTELWEPLTPFSWMIITQLSFGFIALKVLQNLYQDYGKELISYVIDLLSIFGDSVEASLDESLKEEFQAQQDGSGARLIKKVDKRFQNIAGIQRILPECSEIVWFLRNYSFMKSSGLVYLSPINRENRFIRSAVGYCQTRSVGAVDDNQNLKTQFSSTTFNTITKLNTGSSEQRLSFSSSLESQIRQRLLSLALAPSNWLTFEKMIPKGILLVGPPGTGKTLLVQAIAGEANVPVLVQSLSLISQPGESDSGAEKLTDLFKRARELSPCIVFIDEIDTLGVKRQNLIQNPMGTDNLLSCLYPSLKESQKSLQSGRETTRLGKECPFPPRTTGNSNMERNADDIEANLLENSKTTQTESGEPEKRQVEVEKTQLSALIRLLVEMDGLNPLNGVIVFGATNRPEVLDPALIRPGRFDKILPIELPGKQKRVEILKLYAKKLGTAKSISWEYFANRTVGLSAADLAAIMNQSTIQAVFNGQQHTLKTLEYGLNIIYKPKTGPEVKNSLSSNAAMSQESSVNSTKKVFVAQTEIKDEKNYLINSYKDAISSNSLSREKLILVSSLKEQSVSSESTSLRVKRETSYSKKLSQTHFSTLSKLEKLSVQSLGQQVKPLTSTTASSIKGFESNKFSKSLFSKNALEIVPHLSQTWPKTLNEDTTLDSVVLTNVSNGSTQNSHNNGTVQKNSLGSKSSTMNQTSKTFLVYFASKTSVLQTLIQNSVGSSSSTRYTSAPSGDSLQYEFKKQKWVTPIFNTTYANDPFTLNRFGYYQSGKAITQCLLDTLDNSNRVKPETIPVVLNLFPRLKNVRYQDESLKGQTDKKGFEKQLISLFGGKASEILFFATKAKNEFFTQGNPTVTATEQNNRQQSLSKDQHQLGKHSFAGAARPIANWDSNLGVDLKFANKVAHAMVNYWYFYSKKVVTRQQNQLALNHNSQELSQRDTLKFFQELTNQVENEMSFNFKAKGYFRNFQATSGKPWWQVQVAQQVGNLESTYTDWYRIYLPDTDESERNQEWTPPDQFYQNQETHLVRTDITWNDLGKLDRDFLYQSLLLNSFNQAFQILDISRPLLDYFTDYLIRYEIMRQDTIHKCLINYRKFN